MLDVYTVAERLGVSPHTVRGWCRSGELPARQLAGKIWRIDAGDLERWLERQRPATASTTTPASTTAAAAETCPDNL